MKSLLQYIVRTVLGIGFFIVFWITHPGEPDALGVIVLAIGFLALYGCLELAFFYYEDKHLPHHGKRSSNMSGMNILPGGSGHHHEHHRLHHHH